MSLGKIDSTDVNYTIETLEGPDTLLYAVDNSHETVGFQDPVSPDYVPVILRPEGDEIRPHQGVYHPEVNYGRVKDALGALCNYLKNEGEAPAVRLESDEERWETEVDILLSEKREEVTGPNRGFERPGTAPLSDRVPSDKDDCSSFDASGPWDWD